MSENVTLRWSFWETESLRAGELSIGLAGCLAFLHRWISNVYVFSTLDRSCCSLFRLPPSHHNSLVLPSCPCGLSPLLSLPPSTWSIECLYWAVHRQVREFQLRLYKLAVYKVRQGGRDPVNGSCWKYQQQEAVLRFYTVQHAANTNNRFLSRRRNSANR